ncbi:InlB B-repeat-containing protein [Candidatus Saccharibacteria bacterium]|nr:InlB B-repeat-containing protein [Candidatus Saccharibacteria bacterium]
MNPAYSSIALAVFSLLSLFLFPCFLPARSFADTPAVTPSITIGNSGTLAFSVDPGSFAYGSQDITVLTTNYTGYTLTAVPSSNDSRLANSVTGSYIESIEDDAISSEFDANEYGFSTDTTINSSTTYHPVTESTVIKETNSATTTAQAGTFQLTIGAKAGSNTPAGTYSRTFTLTASANDASYSISYNANAGSDTVGNFPSANEGTVSGTTLYLSSKTPTRSGYVFLHWNTSDDDSGTSYNVQGTINLEPTTANPITLYAIWEILCPGICYNGNNDDGTGTMPDQTVSNLSSSQTLIASNFSRAGYGFAGWSEDEDAYTHLTDNNQSNDPTIYGPNETITMPGHALNLYAVWVPAEKDGNNSPVYLQNWLGCASMNDGDLTALTDSRDNSVYAVAKIEKNVGETNEYSRCWLIESLRLDVATANITSENTNHPTITFLQEASALQSVSWDTCPDYSFACLDQISYSLGNINRNNTASHNADNQTSSWYSYGGMYNWYTATAGNGAFSTGSADVTSGSLCPASWNLPTGYDATGDFGKLDIALGGTGGNQYSSVASNRWRAYPFNHLLSGFYYESSALNRGHSGYYWSSSSFAFEAAWSTDFIESISNPGTGYRYKNDGLAIR